MYNHTILSFSWLIQHEFSTAFLRCLCHATEECLKLQSEAEKQPPPGPEAPKNSVIHEGEKFDFPQLQLHAHQPGHRRTNTRSFSHTYLVAAVQTSRGDALKMPFVCLQAGQSSLCWAVQVPQHLSVPAGRKGEATAEGDSAQDVTLNHPLDEPRGRQRPTPAPSC